MNFCIIKKGCIATLFNYLFNNWHYPAIPSIYIVWAQIGDSKNTTVSRKTYNFNFTADLHRYISNSRMERNMMNYSEKTSRLFATSILTVFQILILQAREQPIKTSYTWRTIFQPFEQITVIWKCNQCTSPIYTFANNCIAASKEGCSCS